MAHFQTDIDAVKTYVDRRIGRFENTITTLDCFFCNAAGIKQTGKGIPPGRFRAPPVIRIQHFPVDKEAKQAPYLSIIIIKRRLAGQNFPVLSFVHAKAGHKADGLAFMNDLELVVHIRLRMDVPAHFLVVLAGDLIDGRKRIVIQKGLACPHKPALFILPEKAQQTGSEQIVPKVRRGIDFCLTG